MLLLILGGYPQSSLIAQQSTINWSGSKLQKNKDSKIIKAVYQNSKEIKSNIKIEPVSGKVHISKSTNQLMLKKKVLKLSNEESEKSIFSLDFGKPLNGVNFSILAYYAICKGKCDLETKQSIKVYGFDKNNKPIAPIYTYTYTSTQPKSIDINNAEINILKHGKTEINVSFDQPVSVIKIESLKNRNDPNYFPFVEISEISWLDQSLNLEKNPPVNEENCNQWDIIFAIDISSSINQAERKEIKNSILKLLSYWNKNNSEKEVNVAFIEFNSEAYVSLPLSKLNDESITDGGKIKGYLEKDAINTHSPTKGRTSWESALKVSQSLSQNIELGVLFLISDGAPNLNAQKDQFLKESRENIITIASELKSQGIHIYGIASGDLNEQNSKIWMGYLTDGKESKTEDSQQEEDFNSLDYITTPSFKNNLTSFNNLLKSCETFERNFSLIFKTYPNPASSIITVFIQTKDEAILQDKLKIELTDLLGKMIYSSSIQANSEVPIDLSIFPAGIYSISLKSSDSILAQKKVSIIK